MVHHQFVLNLELLGNSKNLVDDLRAVEPCDKFLFSKQAAKSVLIFSRHQVHEQLDGVGRKVRKILVVDEAFAPCLLVESLLLV